MAKDNWKTTKKERVFKDEKLVDETEHQELSRSIIVNNYSKILTPIVSILAIFFSTAITVYTISLTNKEEQVKRKYELNAHFSKNLMEDNYQVLKQAKRKVSKILSTGSIEEIESNINELEINNLTEINSVNDTSIRSQFLMILDNIYLFQILKRIEVITMDLEVYRSRATLLYGQDGVTRATTSIRDTFQRKRKLDDFRSLMYQYSGHAKFVQDSTESNKVIKNFAGLYYSHDYHKFVPRKYVDPITAERLRNLKYDLSSLSDKIMVLMKQLEKYFLYNNQKIIEKTLNDRD